MGKLGQWLQVGANVGIVGGVTMRDPCGSGLTFGLIAFTIFLVPAVALWRAKTEFQGEDGQ